MKKMWLIFLFVHCCLAVVKSQELAELPELPEETAAHGLPELPEEQGKLEKMEPEKIWETGFSDQYKSENTLGEYSFGYNEDHTSGGSFRRETSDRLGNKIGSYGLRIGDGRVRVVNYVADQNGFRADVLSNEPGIAPKKNIYTVLVPGFRYSSGAPYVSFEQGQPLSSLYDRMAGQTDQQIEEEGENAEGEEYAEVVYTNQGEQEEDAANIFSNEEANYGSIYAEAKPEIGNIYVQEGQMPEDIFMDGEYSHESETVLNQTANEQQVEQKESEVSSSTESGFKDSTSTVVALLKDNLQKGLLMSQENNYQGNAAAGDDLHPSQSNNVLSQSSEQVIPVDQDNTTWNDSEVTDSSEVED